MTYVKAWLLLLSSNPSSPLNPSTPSTPSNSWNFKTYIMAIGAITNIALAIKKEPKIYVYDSTGSYIKEFENISSVKKELKYNKNDIKRAIKNNSLFQNMYWATFKYTNILKENSEMSKPISKKIYQYDLQGNLIKTWDSITSCQKLYPSAL